MQVRKCIAPNGALGLITKCRALPFLGQHTHVSKSKRRRSKVLQKFEICFKMVKDEKDEKAEKRSGKGKWWPLGRWIFWQNRKFKKKWTWKMYNRPMRILKFCPYLALGRNGIVQCGIYATWLIGLPRHKIVGHGTGRCWHVGWCGWCRGDDVFCRSFFRHHFRCRDCFENPLGTPPGDVHDLVGTRHFKCAKK